MAYEVIIKRKSQKQLGRIQKEHRERIIAAVFDLSQNPRPVGYRKLRDREEEWRIRIGSYRVIYGIDDERRVVEVLDIAHRRDVYR